MTGERKRLKEDVYRLESLLRNLGYTKELLVSLKGNEAFEQHQQRGRLKEPNIRNGTSAAPLRWNDPH